MTDVDTEAVSAGTQRVLSLVDTQARVLACVIGANVRYALQHTTGTEPWLEAPVVEYYDFPVTLNLLNNFRLPSVSVWRVRTSIEGAGARHDSRRGSFMLRYWLNAMPPDHLPLRWAALQVAFEVAVQTLLGDALIDLEMPGEKRIPSTELLKYAGIEFVHKESIVGSADFAADVSGVLGQLYPVLEIAFETQHVPMFGGLVYPAPVDWPDLEQLCFQLWDGTPVESGGRLPEDQPIVEGKSLIERSMERLNGGTG